MCNFGDHVVFPTACHFFLSPTLVTSSCHFLLSLIRATDSCHIVARLSPPMVNNSKRANNLGNVMRQLKSGMTRGTNPRNLTPAEIFALQQKRDCLHAETRAANKERAVNRIIAHHTDESDRVITQVSTAIVAASPESSTFSRR